MAASAQTSGSPPPNRGGTSRASVEDPPGTPPPATFHLPNSDITFQYPAEFHIENPAEIEHRNYRAAHGAPEERLSIGCDPILLEVGAGNPLISVQPADAKHFVPDPPTGGIVLQELMSRCFNAKSTEDAFAGIVDAVRHMDGYTPLASMVSYKLNENFTLFAGSAAYSKDKDGVRRPSVGQTLVASVGMRYKERFFLWTITANDPEIFNQLLGVRLQFGADRPWPLVPFRAGKTDGKGDKNAIPR